MDERPSAIKLRRHVRAGLVLATMCTGLGRGATNVEPGLKVLRLDVEGATFELVRIPTGTFLMGAEDGDSDERPVHEVRIGREFYLGRTEVTVGQYKAFCKARGYLAEVESQRWLDRQRKEASLSRAWAQMGFMESDEHPAVCVSWPRAVAFCRWLSDRTGKQIRLPSEAEGEYVCRAGRAEEHSDYLDKVAWYALNSGGTTHAVGTKKPNSWGLYDMHGNAWEWCQDNWHENYEGAPADGTMWKNPHHLDHVVRGGAWCRNPWVLRSAYRYHAWPDCASVNFGFRIVRTCPGNCVKQAPATSVTK